MKHCLFATAILLTASANAQHGRIEAGVNLANVSVTNNGRVDKANMLTSFRVGIVGDIKVAPMIALQPGVYYTGKGSKVENGQPGDPLYFKQTTNPFYIEVPANIVFKFPFASESHFFIGAGPYIAMGVGGKATTDMSIAGGPTTHNENSIQFSNDDPTTFNQEENGGLGVMKRFDYGANGVVGIAGKSITLSANYGLGLAKLQSQSSNTDNNNKHRVISLNIGFRL